VATKWEEQKARQVPVQASERFMALLPSGQQTDVATNEKNLVIMYRDLRSEMLTDQEQVRWFKQ